MELKDLNLVIISQEAGAGHLRQMRDIARYLEQIGLTERMSIMVLGGRRKNKGDVFIESYKSIQGNEKLSRLVYGLVQKLGFLADQVLVNVVDEKPLLEKLKRLPHFDPARDTMFLTTHPEGAIAAVKMGRAMGRKTAVVEFVPDPWRGVFLKIMTTPIEITGRHVAVFHDEITAAEFRKVRPNAQREILGWGTLSDAVERRPIPNPIPVILVETAGNELPVFDRKIVEFLKFNKDIIAAGQIKVVIHAMNHTGTRDLMINTLSELGMSDTVPVIWQEKLLEAIESREEWVRQADACLVKGGEVPLEDRGDKFVVGCIYHSAPHEILDIETGVKDGRALDLREVPVNEWKDRLLSEINRRVKEEVVLKRSTALLAIEKMAGKNN